MLLLLLVAVAAVSAIQLPLTYTDSLRVRLYKEGKLAEYVQKRNERLTSKDAVGSTGVIDYEDMAYMISITLGTPGQTFVTFIDSGSANLWVPDQNCGGDNSTTCGSYCHTVPYEDCLTFCASTCCKKTVEEAAAAATNPCASKHRFIPSTSSTFKTYPGTFSITYNTGDVVGTYGSDVFCLSGTTLCANSQVFGLATTIGADFGKQPEDGIIGLGWPALAVDQVKPPMFSLKDQGKLDKPLFTVYMAGIGPTSSLNGGTFTAGDVDTTNCGNVSYIPLTSKTFWQFKMSGVKAGTYSNTPSSGWQTISSTSSSLIGGPKAVIDSIATAVGAKYYAIFDSYFIDCDAETPDIIFTINGVDYHITPKNYVISMGTGPCLFAFFATQGGGFYPSWMLGPPLIREYCQVHDMQNEQIGMAKVLPH